MRVGASVVVRSVSWRVARARTAAGGIARSEQAARLARPKGAPLTSKSQIPQRKNRDAVLCQVMCDGCSPPDAQQWSSSDRCVAREADSRDGTVG